MRGGSREWGHRQHGMAASPLDPQELGKGDPWQERSQVHGGAASPLELHRKCVRASLRQGRSQVGTKRLQNDVGSVVSTRCTGMSNVVSTMLVWLDSRHVASPGALVVSVERSGSTCVTTILPSLFDWWRVTSPWAGPRRDNTDAVGAGACQCEEGAARAAGDSLHRWPALGSCRHGRMVSCQVCCQGETLWSQKFATVV